MAEACFICINPECENKTNTFSQVVCCPICRSPAQVAYPRASPSKTPNAAVVLVLDGGGMKGLSSLFILDELMKEVRGELSQRQIPNDQDDHCPGDYFNFIMGTSTGGIIAIMQGIFGLNVPQCISEYKDIGRLIFARPRTLHIRNALFPRSKYDTDDFEGCISNFVKNRVTNSSDPHTPKSRWHYWRKFGGPRLMKVVTLGFRRQGTGKVKAAIEPEYRFNRSGALCKTAVFSSVGDGQSGEKIFVFRSYDLKRREDWILRNPGRACEASIVEVARATSAAPSYFKQIGIDKRDLCLDDDQTMGGDKPHEDVHYFIDGGTTANNPSDVAWDEAYAWQMAASREDYSSLESAMGCIVSIGCGRTRWQLTTDAAIMPIRKYLRMIFSMSKIMTETEPTHRRTRDLARQNNVPYYRFNVQQGLQDVKMDEWTDRKRKYEGEMGFLHKTKEKISTHDYIKEVTRRYINGETETEKTVLNNAEEPAVSAVRKDLQAVAKILVDYKLARENAAGLNLSNGAVVERE